MNFDYTDHEQELLQWGIDLGKFLQEKDRNPETFQKELWKEMAQKNIFETIVPTEFNGLGFSALDLVLILQGISRHWKNLGMLFAASAQLFACMIPMIRFGSQQQKEEIFSRVFKGEVILANLMTEPGSGSDCFALQTTAAPASDGTYSITGSKCFGTNAPIADYFVTYAKTRPSYGFLGISCFLIPKNSKNITMAKPYEKMGLNGSLLGDVSFDQCTVGKDRLIGKDGQGGTIFNTSMNWERTCLFAIYLGMMERQLQEVTDFVKVQNRFGKTLSKFQLVQDRVVEMKKNLEISRLLLYQAAHDLNKGKANELHSSLSKVFTSQAAVENSLHAIQLYGAYGYTKESGIEMMLRDSIPARIFSGSNEIQRQVIARELGL
ncbi:MAG: acyl-CoA dehydrogenase family protein [Candidatus Aminicenantes bacterium]|jgi:clorobiocin biosynthesis protein CloN3